MCVLGLLALAMAATASGDQTAAVRYQPLAVEAAEVSRSLLYRYLSDPAAEPGPLLADALRVKLGPFLTASFRRQSPDLAAKAAAARLRVELDAQLAISAEVIAFTQRTAQVELLSALRRELLSGVDLQLRAPTVAELQAIWPNIGWDLSGGVWVAQAGERRLLFDLPSAAPNDHFVYIETLDPQDSCFRLGELAAELGAECLCATTSGAADEDQIQYQTTCPADAPKAGAPVLREKPQEQT
jgi:hypothetical protein